MSTTPPTITKFPDLFTPAESKALADAPLQPSGTRHPTWFPLHSHEPRVIDMLVREAVPRIALEAGGEVWLRDLAPRLSDFADDRNASSSLAEIRAYGGLLEAGFNVAPIPRTSSATPDFTVDVGDGPVTVEVFSKHQDEVQDALMAAVHSPDGEHELGIERSSATHGNRRVTTAVTVLTPGGHPDPDSKWDSVQANLISKVCGMKRDETQVDPEHPCVLIADFCHFGGPTMAKLLEPRQTAPVISGHRGLCSGAMWYGVYGWKGARVFEELLRDPLRMGHDGRFRLAGKKKSRLSAILFIFHGAAVLLENPWADKPLTPLTRLAFGRYPWFDLVHSVADWHPGDALALVELQRRRIEAFDV